MANRSVHVHVHAVAFFLRASPAWARSRVSFFVRVALFELLVCVVSTVELSHVEIKVARNEVENASFAQRSAHRDSRIWRLELIEPAAERKRRARGRRPTFKSAYPDRQILPQCNISSNYPL